MEDSPFLWKREISEVEIDNRQVVLYFLVL